MSRIDARAWVVWTLTTLVVASSTRNPLYVLLLLMITLVVSVAWASAQDHRRALSPLRFAAIAVPMAALFNGLTAHLGDTVLMRLPEWLPLLGGPVTLEALFFGATNGLTLTAIFGGFATFNQVTSARDLVRLAPRAFHEAGVVLSIALTFIPHTTRSLARIREAQAVRGHRVRGLRDWLPIMVPLLVSGLERSMGLAEAMVARGYGAVDGRARPVALQAILAGGLLTTLGGWLARSFLPRLAGWGTGSLVLGTLMLLLGLRLAGRSVRRTRYRATAWGVEETLVVAGVVAALLGTLAPLPGVDRLTLAYVPYPRLIAPPFDPLLAVLLMGLLVPAALAVARRQS